ncbi:hypothetical protein AMJ80_06195 [bacterium SM23_31]|nr:MAG: hypothetical protein AMJ80_06195 [bacterium SM23_31]
MKKSKVLYITGSIGMGHVIKDMAIVNKLRKLNQNVEITWIATNPATDYLKDKGESLHAMSHKFSSYSAFAEQYAKTHYTFIGYIIRFDPAMYKDKMKVRKKLGYDEIPLIVCSIGGTAIGKGLLELCNRAYPILKSKINQLRMVLVTGPRLAPNDINTLPGVEIRGFVPDLYQHYAACDLAIVQGGFSSTLELTALRRPFIFFPIEGHSEQEYVAKRLGRHNAGIRMDYSKTTPTSLADQVLINLNKSVSYKALNTDGAQNAAEIINKYL